MNVGKKFEDRVYKGFDRCNVYWERFHDFPGLLSADEISFTPTNPYDCFVYFNRTLFCFELKSTKNNSLTIGPKRMIKPHQVSALHKASRGQHVVAGFLIEFRSENEIYFIHINDFLKECESGKQSIHYKQILRSGVIVGNSNCCYNIIHEVHSIYYPGSY